MNMKCVKCGHTEIVKNGIVFGGQRFKCKHCGYQFTKVAPAGKPLFIKLVSHSLYVSGLSMREVAKIVGVTVQSISRWIKKWHPAYMAEIGNKETLTTTTRDELLSVLKVKKNEVLLVSSMPLPSGATYNIVVQLPSKRKSLKK